MELRIVPSTDMNINLEGKTVGKLEALVLDTSKTSMLGIPSVKLSISLDGNAFKDASSLQTVVNKVSKFKFLDIVLRNVKKG